MYRTETDFLGEKPVPAAAYYGIHTVRALENFAVSRQTVHPELIRAIATVKPCFCTIGQSTGSSNSTDSIPICLQISQNSSSL